jgi:nicotinamidase-related amidase
MPNKVCLLTIDPQVDFCEGGALPVTGATKDLERLAKMVDKHGGDIDDIQITLDSHYHVHVAHAAFWIDAAGAHPPHISKGVTVITEADIISGKWRPTNPNWKDWALQYVQQLSANKRYALVIWPDHCIIGSRGQTILPVFFDAVTRWEHKYTAIAPRTTKGSNPFTEHYSAVKADCPHPEDEGTRLNGRFVKTLQQYDDILISGEALSHCVANTIRDVANEFSADQVKKFVLLEDASSNVPTFEKMGQDFVNEMSQKGMRVAKTDTFFK